MACILSIETYVTPESVTAFFDELPVLRCDVQGQKCFVGIREATATWGEPLAIGFDADKFAVLSRAVAAFNAIVAGAEVEP